MKISQREIRELDELRRKRPSIRPYAIETGVCVIAIIVAYTFITNIQNEKRAVEILNNTKEPLSLFPELPKKRKLVIKEESEG